MNEKIAQAIHSRYREELEMLLDSEKIPPMEKNDSGYHQVTEVGISRMSSAEERAFRAGVLHGLGEAGTIAEEVSDDE